MAGTRRLSALVSIGVVCGGGLAAAGATGPAAQAATVTCPTVAANGTVTPAPTFGVNWSGCDLSGANLKGAELASADLTGADLHGASLGSATLNNARLNGADLSGAGLGGADLYVANLTSANLSAVSMAGANAQLANLTSADLSNADASNADLDRAYLMKATLSGTKLAGASLDRALASGIAGIPASLPSAAWMALDNCLIGPGVALTNADLSSADLSGMDLTGAQLSRVKLAGANLSNVNLSKAWIGGIDLSNADISGINLTGTSSFGQVTSGGLIASTPPTLPPNWQLTNGYLIGPSANLTGADLSGLDLSGSDLAQATITNANVTGTSLAGATITYMSTGGLTGQPKTLPAGLSIVDGYLAGPKAYLYRAALSGVNLGGYDLTGAYLGLANLSGANLAGTTLTGAFLSQANLTGADLSGAVVTGANAAGATLTSADLSGVDLSTDYLAGVTSGGITAGPARLPANWQLVDEYLAGPNAHLNEASLAGANLSGLDLEGAELSAADLANVNLNGANLTAATLSGATVTGATFTGVTWRYTTCPDGSTSNKYVAGCFSAVDTTPPAVTVTGVGRGKVYVTGAVPAAGCTTTDNGTVASPATVTTVYEGTGAVGWVGLFTATCSGALDLAGNEQTAPVSVTYTVVYGLHGFIAPASGATIARSSKTITMRVRLTSSSGAAISATVAKSLAAHHDVRLTLAGPGIKPITVNASWSVSQADFSYVLPIPSGVRTGSAQKYTIMVTENVGTGYLTVPAVRGTVNPEVIHFR
jgi:uncharacterized protein YjbI with pentapeptide repeats